MSDVATFVSLRPLPERERADARQSARRGEGLAGEGIARRGEGSARRGEGLAGEGIGRRGESLKARPEPTNRLDKLLLLVALALLGFGIVMVYSSSTSISMDLTRDRANPTPLLFLKRQLQAAAVALFAMILTIKIGYRRLAKFVLPILLVTLVAVVAAKGYEAVKGGSRWIRSGALSVQPSEFAKLALALYLAHSLAKKRDKLHRFSIGFLPHYLVTGVLAGAVLLGSDLGTAVLLTVMLFVLLFAAGTKLGYIIGGAGVTGLVAWFALIKGTYREGRLKVFLDPWIDKKLGFQIRVALMTIGSGGLFGVGLGKSALKHTLPEAHTDFIFAIIAEEFGLVGVAALIAAYGILIWRGLRAAFNASDAFGSYLALGVTTLFGAQALLNMLVSTGLLPTKGLTLPFVSYGGTSLVVSMIGAGLLLSIGQGRGGFLRPAEGGTS